MGSSFSFQKSEAVNKVVNESVQSSLTKSRQTAQITALSSTLIKFNVKGVVDLSNCKMNMVTESDIKASAVGVMDKTLRSTATTDITNDLINGLVQEAKQSIDGIPLLQFTEAISSQKVRNEISTLVKNTIENTQSTLFGSYTEGQSVIDVEMDNLICDSSEISISANTVLRTHATYLIRGISESIMSNETINTALTKVEAASSQKIVGYSLMAGIGVVVFIVIIVIIYKIATRKKKDDGGDDDDDDEPISPRDAEFVANMRKAT